MGLDNISVFDRSMRLPVGYKLKQSDATGWMTMFALNLTVMALELAVDDPDYEDTAIQTYGQFLNIAYSVAGHTGTGVSLWDADDAFFKDLLPEPNGTHHRVNVYSWVGFIPLLACEVIDQRLQAKILLSHIRNSLSYTSSGFPCGYWPIRAHSGISPISMNIPVAYWALSWRLKPC